MVLVGNNKDGPAGGHSQVQQDLGYLCHQEGLAGAGGSLDDGYSVCQGVLDCL